MSSSNVREDTPQPTMSVTEGSCVLSMFWNSSGKKDVCENIFLCFWHLMRLVYIYGFQPSRHRLNRVHIHRATNRKRKIKTIAADRHRGICGGLRCVCWQELSAVEYRSREIPLLARFAESSLPNWVTHGSNAASYIFLTITTVSLMLWGAKVHKNCTKA